jgi:hypothetical protein
MIKHLLKYILTLLLFFASIKNVEAQRVHHNKVTAINARAFRDSVKLKIFGTTTFPYSIFPESVVTNINTIDYYSGTPYNSIMYPLGNLDSIDKFSVKLDDNLVDFPQNVSVYLFHPHNSNGKLFIYHSGHCAGTNTVEDILGNNGGTEPGIVIPGLLKEGYTVLAVPMIYYGFSIPNGLSCGSDGHNNLFNQGHYPFPLSFFFKPLIASLNQVNRSNYSAIYMCGLSGGGWTTSVYPAIDSSISYSFPVAGSWPLPLNTLYNSGGDNEQYYPPLFQQLLDYHELYTLGCLAPARKMVQINNRYDACCFAGEFQHIYYADSVTNALRGTGAVYRFYLDETETGHQISKRALNIMLTFIRNDTAFLINKPVDSVMNGQNYSYDIKNNFGLNTVPDNSVLKYSLLKAPDWLSLNEVAGKLEGIVPAAGFIIKTDTVSFKVEDSTGRFVLYNYIITKKRDAPYFFTSFENDSIVYFLPAYRNSVNTVNPAVVSFLSFNNPLVSVMDISVENNSVYRLRLNRPVSATDSIAYNGYQSPYALTYNNGLKIDNFGLTHIQLNAVSKDYAVPGMIRFNTETMKFEFFNGTTWVNMN